MFAEDKVLEKDPALKKHFKIAYDTYLSRDAEYGSAFEDSGKLIAALFPNGVELKIASDFTRYNLVCSVMGKMHRYARNFHKGGHEDSPIDAAVYSLMLNYMDHKERKAQNELNRNR